MQSKADRNNTLIGLAAVAAALVVIAVFDPAQHSIYGICIFKYATGYECAGCGTLRGLHAFLHGDFGQAWRLNPLLIISLPFAILFTGYSFGLMNRAGIVYILYQKVTSWYVLLVAVIGWTILRNTVFF